MGGTGGQGRLLGGGDLSCRRWPQEDLGTELSRQGNREQCRERDVAGCEDIWEGGQHSLLKDHMAWRGSEDD